MKTLKIAMVALVAVATILPAVTSPAEAKKLRFYNRVYNNAYTPYGYNSYAGYPYGYSPYQAKQQAANGLINQVNSMIQSGQITVQQGNAMLIQGHI
jgi:hypothetical protein